MYSRLRPNAMAATTARPTHLACLTAHACMPATTNIHVLGQWRDGWAGQEWGMPPRCLEKGQLSSRIMREVLQSGGRAGDGRTCREGGMWGEHAGGAISRTTWPHASKARGHITPGGRRPDPTHNPRYPVHTTRTPPRAAWRRGAAGDAHSLVAATHAHGEASALHPRRDHPLRASLRKLGGDVCLAAPLVCGHAAARCGLHVCGGWCLQASLPARSAGRAARVYPLHN